MTTADLIASITQLPEAQRFDIAVAIIGMPSLCIAEELGIDHNPKISADLIANIMLFPEAQRFDIAMAILSTD
jgi:ABC-type ATPase involved in cell division